MSLNQDFMGCESLFFPEMRTCDARMMQCAFMPSGSQVDAHDKMQSFMPSGSQVDAHDKMQSTADVYSHAQWLRKHK